MPEFDLSAAVPPEARRIRLRYEITTVRPGARRIARVWTGADPGGAVVLEGPSGEVEITVGAARRLNYQFPVTVRLKMRVVAYSAEP